MEGWTAAKIGAILVGLLVCSSMAFAQCAPITNWSQDDFNSVLYPTVVAVNTPGELPQGPQAGGPATYIVAVPRPEGVRTLANNSSITIYSFASAADAAVYYGYRRRSTVLPVVYDAAGATAIVSSTLRQGALSDLYLDALHASTVILVAGYADSTQTMASAAAVNLYLNFLGQAKALVDAKCNTPTPQPNRAPTVALAPDPAAVPAFQEGMTRGLEFEIRIDDPDGLQDLDPGSFRMWVAGVDKTRHFLETVAMHPSRLRQVNSATGTTYYIRHDPHALMSGANYFNIQWNGTWPVSLGICDRGGACARADYAIYFGPYFATTEATWLGQAGGGCVGGQNEIRFSFILGNNGYESIDTEIYVGLLRPSDAAYWTYGRDNGPNQWHAMTVVLLWQWPSAPSGVRISPPDEVVFTMLTDPPSKAISAGEYLFLTGARTASATDLLMVPRSAHICTR